MGVWYGREKAVIKRFLKPVIQRLCTQYFLQCSVLLYVCTVLSCSGLHFKGKTIRFHPILVLLLSLFYIFMYFIVMRSPNAAACEANIKILIDILISFDAVQIANLQGMHQFNGSFGRGAYHHAGKRVRKGFANVSIPRNSSS